LWKQDETGTPKNAESRDNNKIAGHALQIINHKTTKSRVKSGF
jgi:hypothetical protein